MTITVDDPTKIPMLVGSTTQLRATCQMTLSGTQDVTDVVEWTSSNTDLLEVVDGLVTAVGLTTDTIPVITASYDTLSDAISVPTSDVVLTRLSLNSHNLTLGEGNTYALTATAHYSDGNLSLVTNQVVWVAEDTSVVAVNSGVVTGLSSGGSTTVTANWGYFDATATVTVNAVGSNTIVEFISNSSADDAEEDDQNGAVDVTNTYLYFRQMGVRFPGISIPQGTQIQTAHLAFFKSGDMLDRTVDIYVEDVADAHRLVLKP